MRRVILALLMVLVGSVGANDYRLEVGLATWHPLNTPLSQDFNNNSKFFGIQYKGWQAATFLNSYHGWEIYGEEFNGRSYAIGYGWDINDVFGIDFGLIHGYGVTMKNNPVRLGNSIVYAAPRFTVWGEYLGAHNTPLLRDVGVRLRVLGLAPSASIVYRF